MVGRTRKVDNRIAASCQINRLIVKIRNSHNGRRLMKLGRQLLCFPITRDFVTGLLCRQTARPDCVVPPHQLALPSTPHLEKLRNGASVQADGRFRRESIDRKKRKEQKAGTKIGHRGVRRDEKTKETKERKEKGKGKKREKEKEARSQQLVIGTRRLRNRRDSLHTALVCSEPRQCAACSARADAANGCSMARDGVVKWVIEKSQEPVFLSGVNDHENDKHYKTKDTQVDSTTTTDRRQKSIRYAATDANKGANLFRSVSLNILS
ncbi:hypothetical protein M513_12424 [Trichuris suis]|uniref:Uncharacterized protein n=1 Tax=Trichuris suis TaxID=68888 RepID=A0A085LP18_9BILA|nr:hypothetical protein M513_12424 [Trichuris suis]